MSGAIVLVGMLEPLSAGTELDNDSLSDPDRRRLLTGATAAMGIVGALLAAVPFVESLEPSERVRALGAPAEIDIGGLKPNHMLLAQWRKKPVCVLCRSQRQLAELPKLNPELKDPLSHARQQPSNLPNWNPIQRSIRPQYLVVVGICTHLGCLPKYRPAVGDPELGPNWPGGFYCACHGSRYDLAGRVMDGSPAPLNLPVPPHYYRGGTILVAGELEDGAQQSWQPDIW